MPTYQVISRNLIYVHTQFYLSWSTAAGPRYNWGHLTRILNSSVGECEYSASSEPHSDIAEDGRCTTGGSSWMLLDVAGNQRTGDSFQSQHPHLQGQTHTVNIGGWL